MRTEMLRSIGGYDENLRNCEDYDLLYRINKSGYKGFLFAEYHYIGIIFMVIISL